MAGMMAEKRGKPRAQKDRSRGKQGKSRVTPSGKMRQLHDDRKVKLLVRALHDEGAEGLPLILFEGNRASLNWLADFIRATAADYRDCGNFVSPDGPGNLYFNKKSEFGIYVHRLPCLEKKV
jgi:hypothetical protein